MLSKVYFSLDNFEAKMIPKDVCSHGRSVVAKISGTCGESYKKLTTRKEVIDAVLRVIDKHKGERRGSLKGTYGFIETCLENIDELKVTCFDGKIKAFGWDHNTNSNGPHFFQTSVQQKHVLELCAEVLQRLEASGLCIPGGRIR